MLQQYRQLSELLGGILPPLLIPSIGSTVLDSGWGMGWSVYEMAVKFPLSHITGIDRDASVVEQAQSHVSGLSNVTILEQDIHHFDDAVFSNASFDLIHLHFLAGDVKLQQFPPLMQSMARICRPGGSLVWTEAELPITTSLACQNLCTLVQRGLQVRGHAFTPGNAGNSLGVIAYMGHWLRIAGYQITQSKAHVIDISAGSTGNEAFVTQVNISGKQIRSFLLEAGVTTVTEFEDIFLEMQQDIQDEKFCGLIYLRTLVGMRP
jgi:ubiquinone/menaquinone biosynthesis C-methylase UbiE